MKKYKKSKASWLLYLIPFYPLMKAMSYSSKDSADELKKAGSAVGDTVKKVKSSFSAQQKNRFKNVDPSKSFKIMLKYSGAEQFKKHYKSKRIESIILLLINFITLIVMTSLTVGEYKLYLLALYFMTALAYIANVFNLWQYRNKAILKFPDYLSALLDNPKNILPLKFNSGVK